MYENAKRFQHMLSTKATLQKRMRSAAETFEGNRGDDRAVFEAVVVPVAKSIGIELTYEEACAALYEARELTDDELDAMAGGAGSLYTTIVSGMLAVTMAFSPVVSTVALAEGLDATVSQAYIDPAILGADDESAIEDEDALEAAPEEEAIVEAAPADTTVAALENAPETELASETPAGAVNYVDANGEADVAYECRSYTGEATLSEGWYAVDKNVTLSDIRPTVSGRVDLILCDGCTFTANKGIEVPKGSSLTIWQQAAGTGALTATATDDDAGIGGSEERGGGDITINGGTIRATGDDDGAGIGGGGSDSGYGDIWINGGDVKAYGGRTCGAGIGSGLDNRYAGCITINGGTIYAEGGNQAAGIGGGKNCSGGTIVINGGDVTATNSTRDLRGNGRGGGAGIGSGRFGGKSGTISINGGTIRAYGGSNSAGIGGGKEAANGLIVITGGTIVALSRDNEIGEGFAWDEAGGYGAGIGAGNDAGQGDVIEITGGDVVAQSYGGAGIGAGWKHDGGKVYIGGTAHVLASSSQGAGIGGGGRNAGDFNDAGSGGNVHIAGGAVFAASTGMGAGIGGGKGGNGGTVLIDGGNVQAIGGHLDYEYLSDHDVYYTGNADGDFAIALHTLISDLVSSNEFGGAGIGGGGHGSGGKVSITSGATVTAIAGMSGAHAIGAGNDNDNHGTLEVYGDAKVSTGKSADRLSPAFASDRVSNAQRDACAHIEPCNHESATCTCLSDTAHSIECDYCDFHGGRYGVEHHFDEQGRCVDCGYTRVAITVDPGEGSGQTAYLYCQEGGSFVLPGTNFKAPEGKVFAGWKAALDGKKDVYPAGYECTLSENVTLLAQWADPYQVWVGGTQVNSMNMADVTGNGLISYDPQTATLTVRGNALIKGTCNGSLIHAEGLELTIVGDGIIEGAGGTSYVQAIDVRKGSLTLDGKLSIVGGNQGDISHGILCDRDVIIAGGSVIVKGSNGGIRAKRKVIVKNDVLELDVVSGKERTTSNALRGDGGIVVGDQLQIKVPAPGCVIDNRIVDEMGEDVSHVVIARVASE